MVEQYQQTYLSVSLAWSGSAQVRSLAFDQSDEWEKVSKEGSFLSSQVLPNWTV